MQSDNRPSAASVAPPSIFQTPHRPYGHPCNTCSQTTDHLLHAWHHHLYSKHRTGRTVIPAILAVRQQTICCMRGTTIYIPNTASAVRSSLQYLQSDNRPSVASVAPPSIFQTPHRPYGHPCNTCSQTTDHLLQACPLFDPLRKGLLLFVGCSTSQQHASVSQRRIGSDQ